MWLEGLVMTESDDELLLLEVAFCWAKFGLVCFYRKLERCQKPSEFWEGEWYAASSFFHGRKMDVFNLLFYVAFVVWQGLVLFVFTDFARVPKQGEWMIFWLVCCCCYCPMCVSMTEKWWWKVCCHGCFVALGMVVFLVLSSQFQASKYGLCFAVFFLAATCVSNWQRNDAQCC